MKEAESSFDIMASAKELQAVVGARVDKIYHPATDHLVLTLKLPGEGKSFLHFHVGRWLFVTQESQEMPQRPSDFAMMLRKRIADARIRAVKQQGFERIVVLSLEKEDRYDLVLELFGDGNIILVKDGIIVQPLTSHTWKHRDVRARKEFSFPPPVPDPTNLSPSDFLTILHGSDTDMVRTLATKLNLGGRYSEEICARTGLEKSLKAKDATEADARRTLDSIKVFRDEIHASGKGFVVSKDGGAEDVVPVRMQTYRDRTHEEFGSFSRAVESYISRMPAPKEEKSRDEELEAERLMRKVVQQEAAVMKLQDEGRETQIVGDFIFVNYPEVKKILDKARKVLDGAGDMANIPGFKSYDAKNSFLKVTVKDVVLDLDAKGSVQSSAERYYENAKRARSKLVGVLAALEETRREVEALKEGRRKAQIGVRKKLAPTKRFWFERFRWFVSSEGAIVLGGKDAKSNDHLVKKHLEAGDRYAHADVHGAPSVVVKMREGMTERTLHEACEFAVATSRAWNAKIGSAAGYWVLPEQVSKTPQSGEFLAKGAFVIRGKRNYTDKLQIKLGIGEIEFEGSRKVMGGPEDSVRTRCKRFVILRPGSLDKDFLAKQLADIFEVPIEEVQSIMPPGDVEIVEQVGITLS